eukprot:467694_1
MSAIMMPDIDMPPHSTSNDQQMSNQTQIIYPATTIDTGKTKISAPHTGFSAMQYQSLKQNAAIPVFYPPPAPQFSPPSVQTVFVIDSKGSEEQDIEMANSEVPQMQPLPIILENEQEILKDIEMDCLLYGNENELVQCSVDEHPDDDLTIKIKQESNIFNTDLVHTEIVHPRRSSAEERASVLLSRAFAPSSPEVSRFSNRLSTVSMNGLNLGFGDSYGRLSQNLFAPLPDDFRISDNFANYAYDFNRNSNILSPAALLEQHELATNSMNDVNMYPDNNHNITVQSVRNIPPQQNSSGSSKSTSVRGGGRKRAKKSADTHRACARCHKSKKKCVRLATSGACVACLQKGIECKDRIDGRSGNTGRKKKVPAIISQS